jgi:small subunit ribosomal protein S17
MADKKDNENAESPAGVPAPEADLEATDAAPAPAPADEPSEVAEVSAAEAAPEEPVGEEPVAEVPAAEAASEEPVAEEPVAGEPAADAEEAPAAQEAPAEPVEVLAPKERRRKARSTHSGEPAPTRSPEDRHAERLAERRTKAVRRRARRLQEREKKAAKRSRPTHPTDTPVAELAPVHAPAEGKRSVRQGIVVSDKADKTITVRIDFARRHRRYEKIVRSSSTLHAHDEQNDAHEGDTVRVIESRPLSKSKRWKLVDVLERAR